MRESKVIQAVASISGYILEKVELLGRNVIGWIEYFTVEGCSKLQGGIVKVDP